MCIILHILLNVDFYPFKKSCALNFLLHLALEGSLVLLYFLYFSVLCDCKGLRLIKYKSSLISAGAQLRIKPAPQSLPAAVVCKSYVGIAPFHRNQP